MTPKSHLYVPGNDEAKLARALSRGAEALIIDLEDAVPLAAKAAARTTTRSWLHSTAPGATQVWLRVNPGRAGHVDLTTVLAPEVAGRVTGVIVAKAESSRELAEVDEVLTRVEQEAGLAGGRIGVVPLLESAAALLDARSLAASPRVRRLQLGEADLAADLGVTPSADGRELDHARATVVTVSAAARLDAPVAPVSTDFRDTDSLAESTRRFAAMGFYGRACIHPAQVPVVHAVFSPSAEQVERARRLVESFDRAVEGHQGVFVAEDGSMVDEAVVRSARRTLERAGLL